MALSLFARLPPIFKINSLSKLALTSAAPRVHVRIFSVNSKCAPLLNPKSSDVKCKRTFFQFFKKPSAEKLKEVDGIPEEYKLIYRNTMYRYLFAAQVFSFASAAIVCILALTYNSWEYNLDTTQWRINETATPIENEGLIYAGTFVTLCVILQLMVSKMPIRIYNLPQRQKYVFVFYGSVPLSKKRLVCKVSEVIKLEESGLLPWKDSRYEIVNKRRIIMLENCFRRPADLNIMLGYQKPPEDYD